MGGGGGSVCSSVGERGMPVPTGPCSPATPPLPKGSLGWPPLPLERRAWTWGEGEGGCGPAGESGASVRPLAATGPGVPLRWRSRARALSGVQCCRPSDTLGTGGNVASDTPTTGIACGALPDMGRAVFKGGASVGGWVGLGGGGEVGLRRQIRPKELLV